MSFRKNLFPKFTYQEAEISQNKISPKMLLLHWFHCRFFHYQLIQFSDSYLSYFSIIIIIIIIIIIVNRPELFHKQLFHINFLYQKIFSQFASGSKNSDWSGHKESSSNFASNIKRIWANELTSIPPEIIKKLKAFWWLQ